MNNFEVSVKPLHKMNDAELAAAYLSCAKDLPVGDLGIANLLNVVMDLSGKKYVCEGDEIIEVVK